MNNLWYSLRELRKSWVFKVIVLIQITIATILLYRANEIRDYEYGKLNLMSTITKNKTIYAMMSKYQSIDEFAKDSENINKFSAFSRAVQKKYNLVTVTYGEVFMKNFKNIDEFEDPELKDFKAPDGYKIVNSLQCSSNFFSTFNIKLSQGELSKFLSFTKLNSNEIEGKTIPIILGDSYRGIFKMDDIIKTKSATFLVAGFLNKNQFYLDKGIYEPSRAKSLNTFILVPSPADIEVYNINNSLIVCDNSKKTEFYYIQKDIDEIAKTYDVKISISNPKENIDSFVEMVNYNANIKLLIVYIVMFFVFIGLLAIFSNRINARRKEFSLHIMHGATYKDIYIRILLEHFYLLILSIIGSSYVLLKTQTKLMTDVISFDLIAFVQSVFVILGIMFIVAIIPIYNISKNRLNYLIKGD